MSAKSDEAVEVWIDQELCTGDGICAQFAEDVFELDVDGLAYVKDADGNLVHAAGGAVPVPPIAVLDVIESAEKCPGDCIHVRRQHDGVEIYGPDADA